MMNVLCLSGQTGNGLVYFKTTYGYQLPAQILCKFNMKNTKIGPVRSPGLYRCKNRPTPFLDRMS